MANGLRDLAGRQRWRISTHQRWLDNLVADVGRYRRSRPWQAALYHFSLREGRSVSGGHLRSHVLVEGRCCRVQVRLVTGRLPHLPGG